MLAVKNLSLTFLGQKSEVFSNLNLSVTTGEIVLLTGPSGVGKSAFLMSLAGLIPETYEGNLIGQMSFLGQSLMGRKPCDLAGDLAYMIQDSDSQLCMFTVADEMAFGLENLRVAPKEMDPAMDAVLDACEIAHLKNRKINELSGGEKQKVAFAALMVMKPKLILMDEPTANLDPQATRDMVKLIKRLNQEQQTTFVIVEHKVDDFIDLASRVVSLTKTGFDEISKLQLVKQYECFKSSLLSHHLPDSNLPGSVDSSQVVLKLEKLSFAYGKNTLPCIQNLDLTVKKGQIMALAGANGAGKSTLSKLMMGLLKPTSGTVSLLNQPLQDYRLSELGKVAGYVFQNPEHQFIKSVVEDELALSLKIAGIPDATSNQLVETYLEKFNLTCQRQANPFMLSQGQKRRLSAASMLINGQPLLILDEPTYGQDHENLLELVNLLREVNQTGVTILMITHDPLLIRYVADSVAILESGQMVYTGVYDEVVFKRHLFKGEVDQ